MKMYVISDHHFNHVKIIDYCRRPFKNVDEMNEAMVERWNSVVEPPDVVYHVGDFGFDSGPQASGGQLRDLIGRLNGRKVLIRGNHDSKSFSHYYSAGWAAVMDWCVVEYGGATMLLKHVPIMGDLPHAVDYVVCGHLHEKTPNEVANIRHPDRHLNVSVERMDYTPIRLERALDMLRKGVTH